MQKDYYLGLDIGTDSVGWAVTNKEYEVPKFRQNAMWGIRLFDESETALERRTFRSARRRTQRKKERISYLQMIFDEEICKKDVAFYQRLKDSSLYIEDKTSKVKYCVFNDDDFNDKDFHEKYKTIYHLRRELIENPNEHDVRLVYLALHHIIKNRGHFLFDSLSADNICDFEPVYNDLKQYMSENHEIELECLNIDEFKKVLKSREMSKTKKKDEICRLFGLDKKEQAAYCLYLLAGASVKLCDVFDDESLKDASEKNITFSNSFDDKAAEYESILGERFELIETLKAVYDWAVLADILAEGKYISFAKVKVYEQHESDLKTLKKYVKEYAPDKYFEIFKLNKSTVDNYTAYSAHSKKNGKTAPLENRKITQEDFCKYLSKTLGKCENENYNDMFERITLGTFMPKQVSKDNSVIPMQINRAELVKILDNAKGYLPFLNEKDENGKTAYDKIISIFDYRIPYYIGPLNPHSDKHWLVRSGEKIYPWNIKEVVDFDASAENFIKNLTSKCTYLPQYDVIPKNSLLYSKFTVLNELNNLKINGEEISVSLKQDIYNDLFMIKYNVTGKVLKEYLKSRGIEFEQIAGIDKNFKSNLKPVLEFANYNLSQEEKENIIKDIAVFGDDKKRLSKRLRANYGGKITDDEIKKIKKLKFTGWGRLSKEFLTDVYCVYKKTGEVMNIITALWETNYNLMQLLYSPDFAFNSDDNKTFIDGISQKKGHMDNSDLKKVVNDMYISPQVKRPVYQSLLITREIEKIMTCAPEKIFIEVARGPEGKKERKASRKERLVELYKSCKNDYAELYEQLLSEDDDRLRSDKLYLYYTQLGKCAYTGEHIDIGNLMGANSYFDIDHIYPRSKIKDDSLNNRILVKKTVNENKTNIYPISPEIREKMLPFWKQLRAKDLISEEKFKRLIRNAPLTQEELSAFVSRQLVETRQSTKAVATVLKELYPNTEIVYVKASLASDFRHQYDMLKCREVNDLHHAKDAYLNIVVGNVYNVRFTHNKANFVKGLERGIYSLNKMYDYNVDGAWSIDGEKSIDIVRAQMAKNNIRYTRYAFEQHGGLFDQMLLKKGKGQVPIKGHGAISDISKYGGYNRASSKYFSLVRYTDKKGNTVTQLVPIDAYCEKEYIENPEKYVSDIVGFNAKVIMPKIKYNACLSFDGFRMHISSKSSGGAGIVYKPGIQLVLPYKFEKYIKNITKYLSQFSDRKINRFDGILADENIELYDMVTYKLNNTIFSKKFAALGEKLKNKREIFIQLEAENQCYVLAEILKILHANVMSGDLTYIGEAKKSGITTTNSKISEIKGVSSVKLINQSVTGLFENEIELLK